MNSGYHNRSKKDRRESPSSSSSSSRPRSNSKTTSTYDNSAANQRNRTPPKNINGKMPSVANSPSSEPLTDGMAGLTLENVRYPIGSRITARLVNGTEMKGEVVAFDPNFKVVILKSSCKRPGHHDVSILNLTHCADIKIDEEGKESPGEMQALNTQRLQERLRTQIERKKKLITAFKAGISPEGQKLFQYINKTIDEVAWNGERIQVMNKIVIEPPYRPDTVKIKQGFKEDDSTTKNLNHIRKIVEKHLSDVSAISNTSSPVTAVSSSRTSSAASTGASATAAVSGGGAAQQQSPLTTTIPNLPQAPAPPSTSSHSKPSSGSGGSSGAPRSNRNNPGRGKHHEHHPKPMYNN